MHARTHACTVPSVKNRITNVFGVLRKIDSKLNFYWTKSAEQCRVNNSFLWEFTQYIKLWSNWFVRGYTHGTHNYFYPCKDFHWHNASQRQIRYPNLYPKPHLKIMSAPSNKTLNSRGADKMSSFSKTLLTLPVKLICCFSQCSMHGMEITPAATQHHSSQGRLGHLLESPGDNVYHVCQKPPSREFWG